MKVLLGLFRRLLGAVLFCWFVGSVVSFFSGALFTVLPIPWGLPLPWGDFDDFVETPDGRVLVSVRFHSRVLCYDRSGGFLDAHCLPGRARATPTRLAAGWDELLYCRARNKVYVYSSDWDLLSTLEANMHADQVWELDRDMGSPVHAPRRLDEVPADRLLAGGELLFGDEKLGRREVFHCADGSTLCRVGNGLERVSPEGEVIVTYGTPWQLRPFELFFPAFLGCCAFFLFAALGGYSRGLRRAAAAQGGRPPA
jgi:hypothetical protein